MEPDRHAHRQKLKQLWGDSLRAGRNALGWEQAALLLVLCLGGGWAMTASMRDGLLRVMPDDAFYYLQIAWHWAAGQPSSFDGVNVTTGYHPLWQWLLIPLAWMTGERALLARLAALLGLAFMLGSAAWLSMRLRHERRAAAWFPALWVMITLVPAWIYGMEMPLTVLLFTALWLAQPASFLCPRRNLWIGLLCALLMLARLDTFAWTGMINAAALGRAFKRRRTLPFLALMLPQAIGVGGYLLSNALISGHALPIHALLKLSRYEAFSFSIPFCWLYALALLSIPFSLWGAWCASGARLLAAGNLFYLALLLSRGGEETWDWYFVLPVWSLAWLVPAWLASQQGRLSKQARSLLLALMLVGAALGSVIDLARRPNPFAPVYDQARALAPMPANSVVLASSDCGALAYFSRQRVLNLDGLTAGGGFLEAIREDTFARWLQAQGLNGYIDIAQPPLREHAVLHTWPGLQGVGRAARVTLSPWQPLGERWHLMRVDKIDPFSLPPGGSE